MINMERKKLYHKTYLLQVLRHYDLINYFYSLIFQILKILEFYCD